jgi:sugar O-acyltransferase (sialic acid O-acetyltransferase NeuD family)
MRGLVLGAGQHGKVVAAIARETRSLKIVGFLDDSPALQGTTVFGYPVLGRMADLELVVRRHRVAAAVVGVSCGHMALRRQLFELVRALGLRTPNVISPHAIVSPEAKLGFGCVLNPGVVINAFAEVGDNCVMYSNTTVEHECRLGENVYLGPGVNFCADVTVGRDTLIGTGARVICPRVGANVTVGAGSVVLRSVPDHVVVAGVPARVVRRKTGADRFRSFPLRRSS